MNRYPLDNQAIEEISRDIISQHRAQNEIIKNLLGFLSDAMDEMGADDTDWHADASKYLRQMGVRKTDYENHRFNQKNGYNVTDKSPFPASQADLGVKIEPMAENKLNAMESTFGEEMSEEDLAEHFNVPKPKKKKQKTLNKMSLEEIESWEKSQDNSNDIYKVSARIKNLARTGGANLTPTGEILCNTYTHVVKGFYDFAETVEDKDTKIKLIELIKKSENMPGTLMAAVNAGVNVKRS